MGEWYRRIMPCVLALYVVAVAAGFLYFNLRLTVEWVAIILFVAALVSGRGLIFLRDWGVFIAVLLAWQLASPLATQFALPQHVTEMIDADRLLFFGHVPALWLQQHLYHPGKMEPWDVIAATLYLLHFLAPLFAGFALWLANRELFAKFALTFVIVAVAGFATYILFPAVPPWMAAQPLLHAHNVYTVAFPLQYSFLNVPPWMAAQPDLLAHNAYTLVAPKPLGHVYLPGVVDVNSKIMSHWYNPYRGTIFFQGLHLHYDQVAAMPSEHAMYPMLFFLFLRRQFGRPAYLVLIYIAAILFAITYLGQHYVTDAIVGFAYAILGYLLVMHLAPVVARHWRTSPRSATVLVRSATELEEA